MNKARVLLVDDDPITGWTLEAWFKHAGYDLALASGPDSANAILSTGSFDFILSDIQMPGNGRLQWVETLFRGACPPPVVLMTGDPSIETAMRAANLPVVAYLLKPINFADLGPLVERLVAEHRQRLELREISAEISGLLTQPDVGGMVDPLLREKLDRVFRGLEAGSGRHPRRANLEVSEDVLRSAIVEAVEVIKRTKGSFHSKELGGLRQRLQRLVPEPVG